MCAFIYCCKLSGYVWPSKYRKRATIPTYVGRSKPINRKVHHNPEYSTISWVSGAPAIYRHEWVCMLLDCVRSWPQCAVGRRIAYGCCCCCAPHKKNSPNERLVDMVAQCNDFSNVYEATRYMTLLEWARTYMKPWKFITNVWQDVWWIFPTRHWCGLCNGVNRKDGMKCQQCSFRRAKSNHIQRHRAHFARNRKRCFWNIEAWSISCVYRVCWLPCSV